MTHTHTLTPGICSECGRPAPTPTSFLCGAINCSQSFQADMAKGAAAFRADHQPLIAQALLDAQAKLTGARLELINVSLLWEKIKRVQQYLNNETPKLLAPTLADEGRVYVAIADELGCFNRVFSNADVFGGGASRPYVMATLVTGQIATIHQHTDGNWILGMYADEQHLDESEAFTIAELGAWTDPEIIAGDVADKCLAFTVTPEQRVAGIEASHG